MRTFRFLILLLTIFFTLGCIGQSPEKSDTSVKSTVVVSTPQDTRHDYELRFDGTIKDVTSLSTGITHVSDTQDYYDSVTYIPSFTITNTGKNTLYDVSIRLIVKQPYPVVLIDELKLGTIQPGSSVSGGGAELKTQITKSVKNGKYKGYLDIYITSYKTPDNPRLSNIAVEGYGEGRPHPVTWELFG